MRDPSAPPRALNAYFVFMLSKREQLRSDDALLGPDVPRRGTGELTKACAELWRAMDAEARQLHLSSFRAGEVPLLIVTDVAARGIDVPMINNVRHLRAFASRARSIRA